MISHQELSDRMEIQNILALYCEAIDNRDWEALDNFFTEDAIIDYTATGGLKCTLPEAKEYLDRALQQFNGGQHMIGVPLINFNGDEAKTRTILFNPMIVEREGQPHVFFVGAWYVDEFVRTDKGWRIRHRNEECSYFHNLPDDFQAQE